MEDYDYLFKVVIIGDSGVGKTNMLLRLTKNEFYKDSKATIGVEFGTRLYKFEDSNVKAQIWDTAGQERYRAITSAYYRGSYGALIVYDITSRESFKYAIINWYTQLKENLAKDIPVMLIGNKKDKNDKREVSEKEGKTYASSNSMLFLETSALSGENIENAFKSLMNKVYKRNKVSEKEIEKKVIDEEELKPQRIPKRTKKKGKKLKYICC